MFSVELQVWFPKAKTCEWSGESSFVQKLSIAEDPVTLFAYARDKEPSGLSVMTLFSEPRNCQSITHADRATALIDGERYFATLRRALLKAQERIYIIGWDIDSRFELLREPPSDGMPVALLELLNALVERNRKLEAYILVWDFTPLLAPDREWLPKFQFHHRTRDRVHFEMQAGVAPGASHHQKFVVIDDGLAFSGGLDITSGRWDSSCHALDDKRRCDAEGDEIPRPYHDVQLMVSGPCARALGEVARQRWSDACGEELRAPDARPFWLDDVPAEFHHCEIAISLTRPRGEPRGELRQVERLYLDMIESARRYIYIENQYLTSDEIGTALARSLSRSEGPEIIVVAPYCTAGWLSQLTMDVLRCSLSKRLLDADHRDRLRIYYPHLPNADEDMTLNVHAKVMVVDDRLLRIGSANLNNRSMGLDSECDLVLQATEQDNRLAVTRFRNRLLAEHLDVKPEVVETAIREHDSVIAAIESLQKGPRTLKLLDLDIDLDAASILPDKALIDPEAPVDSEALREILVPERMRKPTARRLLLGGILLLFALTMTAIWRWTPLAEWVDRDSLEHIIVTLNTSFYAPLVAIGITTVGSMLGIPVSLLVIAVVLIYGALAGGIYSLIGAVASAVLSCLIGQSLGGESLRRLAGPRLDEINRLLARRGIMAVALIRMLPVAPFLVVNLVAGASRVRLRDFAIGSLVGMLPGTIALALITNGVIQTSTEPTLYNGGLLLAVVVGLAIVALLIRRWLLRVRDSDS